MIGREQALLILDKALGFSRADQTEAVLIGDDSSLTRFATSGIHQNVAWRDAELRVRAVFGKRVAVASTNDLREESIRSVVEIAATIAQHQAENPDFVSLPKPEPMPAASGFAQSTIDFTPAMRGQAVAVVCRKAGEQGMTAAGAFSTGAFELAVANSLGIRGYHAGTSAGLSTVISSTSSTGYAEAASPDVAEIDVERVADEAVGRAARGRNPGALPPGDYEVILEEYAASDILDYLAYLGFSALAVQEHRSFMDGKVGQKIVGDNVSIWDDGLDPTGFPLPFDFEGVPKNRVDLIGKGIASGVVYDSYTAYREGRKSTGHALPAPNPAGPYPLNMFMAPGTSTREEMIGSTKCGILVTRFWYTRAVHPLHVILTGMTRDGTFLVENGEISRPIKNLRFTQGYVEALNNVLMIGRTTKLLRSGFGTIRVPALRISSWKFTSATEY